MRRWRVEELIRTAGLASERSGSGLPHKAGRRSLQIASRLRLLRIQRLGARGCCHGRQRRRGDDQQACGRREGGDHRSRKCTCKRRERRRRREAVGRAAPLAASWPSNRGIVQPSQPRSRAIQRPASGLTQQGAQQTQACGRSQSRLHVCPYKPASLYELWASGTDCLHALLSLVSVQAGPSQHGRSGCVWLFDGLLRRPPGQLHCCRPCECCMREGPNKSEAGRAVWAWGGGHTSSEHDASLASLAARSGGGGELTRRPNPAPARHSLPASRLLSHDPRPCPPS